MVEEKIKIKDLATEIDIPSKDMLKALRELNLPAKSTTGSVSLADAERLRTYFSDRKNSAVERTAVQPNVIVRRRRKDSANVSDPIKVSEPVAKAAVARAEKIEAEKKDISENSPAENSSVQEAPAAQAGKSARENVKAARPAATPKAERTIPRTTGARVIMRPGDRKPEPVKEPVKPVQPKKEQPRAGKTLAQEIREREAAARAKERMEHEAAKSKLKKPASIISKPAPKIEETAEAVLQKPRASSVAEKSVQTEENKTRGVSPVKLQLESMERDANAAKSPAEIPARAAVAAKAEQEPVAGQKSARRAKAEALDSAHSEESGQAVSRVRIISKPHENPQPARKQRSGYSARASDGGYKQQRQAGQERTGGSGRTNASGYAGYGGQGAQAGRMQNMQNVPMQGMDGKDGQSKKKRLKGRRTVDFQQGDFGRHAEEDENIRFNRNKAKRKNLKNQAQPQNTQPVKAAKRKLRVTDAIRVADMAHQLGVKANEIIKVLFNLGVMATINQSLDIDTATVVASEFGYEVEKAGFSEEDYLTPKEADAPESLKPRPPVVTIMGHVDHGKTSLLDAIRKSNVTSGEAGGITQHIGAYHVKTKRGEIVFLDTPGHEAFTAMRARGAQVTDLVILVVAADDGVMEQTREAINHSKAADVPIVVAVNKMDKPGADPDRVLRELSELGLQPEDWGGDTIVAKVSAKTRQGLDDLLELVALQSEIMDLKANPDKPAHGHIIEAKLDKGRGPVATVLIQEGTLHMGDNFVCGTFAGRVRALTNDQGKKVKEAGPSLPVEVQGFDGVPEAGEEFLVVADDRLARRIADSRALKRRERNLASESRVTLETFLAHHNDQEALTLNLVLKADVQGSLEAISEALQKQSTDKVKISIVHGGTGAISESDILLASASRAIIIGFNVRPAARIKDIAERENVDIRYYDIIYKLVDDVKSAMAGMLAPVQREVYLGQAEVRKVYNLPKIGAIAGSYVADGKVARNAGVRLLRDSVVVYTGKIASLKRFKNDEREVVKGTECGIGLENFNDIKEGDVIEAFETVEEAATL